MPSRWLIESISSEYSFAGMDINLMGTWWTHTHSRSHAKGADDNSNSILFNGNIWISTEFQFNVIL